MKRYYFLTDNLDRLQAVETDLENNGISTPQIHVLSRDDSGVTKRHLHGVEAVLRKDVVHGMQRGAIFGICGAALVLIATHFSGITSVTGWAPFIFLAIVVLGFVTWESGLFGIQEPHHDFKRFDQALDSGRHLLFIDVDKNGEDTLSHITAHYPELEFSGTGGAAPGWFIGLQNRWRHFLEVMP